MLHVIYRSYGGENLKGRPSFYSKQLALGSMVRAFRELPAGSAELIYLNDGPIPADRLSIMERTGEIVSKVKLGNKGSLHTAFTMPRERGWAANDLIWFAEDDYLYRHDSMTSLAAAGREWSEADYFGLYALIGNRQPNGEPPKDDRVPRRWSAGEPRRIAGEIWRPALSTTSTFGAWVRTIKADRSMKLLAMECGAAFDHTTCLTYQGFNPYPLRFLARELSEAGGTVGLVRASAIAVIRAGFNVYAAMRRISTPPRVLISCDPALATHMETAFMAQGSDWAAIAADTRAWMQANGLQSSAMLEPAGIASELSAQI